MTLEDKEFFERPLGWDKKMFYRDPASNLQLYNQDPCHDYITLSWRGTKISLLELQETSFNLLFPPIITVHKGGTSFATPSLDSHTVWSTQASFFQVFPIPFMHLFYLSSAVLTVCASGMWARRAWWVRQRKVQKQAPEIVQGNMEQAWYDFN